MNKFSTSLFLIIIFFISSCQKQYSCFCRIVRTDKDTVLDIVKTTKLGSKGFYKTCINYEKKNMKDCHLE